MSTLPRFARKDVRAEAESLVTQGFIYDDIDADGHHVFIWPGTGAKIVVPETPKKSGAWLKRVRRESIAARGVKPIQHNQQKRRTTPQARMVADRHAQAKRHAEALRIEREVAEVAEAMTNLGQTIALVTAPVGESLIRRYIGMRNRIAELAKEHAALGVGTLDAPRPGKVAVRAAAEQWKPIGEFPVLDSYDYRDPALSVGRLDQKGSR